MSVVPTQHSPEPHFTEEVWDAEIRDVLTSQIDDLAKYHVVRMLHEHPETIGDAAFYAAALGFHSVEDTRTVLEEMAECGILRRVGNGGTDSALYCLSSDTENRRKVARLCNLSLRSPLYRQVVRLLANRSLHRAELKSKNRRHRLECA